MIFYIIMLCFSFSLSAMQGNHKNYENMGVSKKGKSKLAECNLYELSNKVVINKENGYSRVVPQIKIAHKGISIKSVMMYDQTFRTFLDKDGFIKKFKQLYPDKKSVGHLYISVTRRGQVFNVELDQVIVEQVIQGYEIYNS